MRTLWIALAVIAVFGASASSKTFLKINGRTIHPTARRIIVTNPTTKTHAKQASGRKLHEGSVRGSGILKTQQRFVAPFNQIRLDISAEVTIAQGDTCTCSITADDNIVPLVHTQLLDRTLWISAKEGFSSHRDIHITLTAPTITQVDLRGSGDIRLDGVTKKDLALELKGSGDITAKGTVENLTAVLKGSGDLWLEDLQADRATVTVSGSGDARIHAREAITATVHGSGDITYSGAPPEVHTDIHGSGDITAR